MIILLTGTPGTGKTTISPLLVEELNCTLIDINQLVDEKQLYTGLDAKKGYKVVDMAALEGELQKIIDKKEDDLCVIIEGHLSHYFPLADFVIVLRTEPSVLEERLTKRDWESSKIHENLEAEALDICTWEAYQTHGSRVHEVDTTNITPQKAVNIILKIIYGEKSHPPGDIDFSGFLTG
ncbi:MAG: putative kinase [Methanobacterium sp. PtaB.Bin024]|jgi:adenylate kinase|nr:MAG: putative kinase [Methanobacterium sp. PtaB.Bin024]